MEVIGDIVYKVTEDNVREVIEVYLENEDVITSYID